MAVRATCRYTCSDEYPACGRERYRIPGDAGWSGHDPHGPAGDTGMSFPALKNPAVGDLHPEVVLSDLAKIFHPELVPDHELYYYTQVGPVQGTAV